MAFCAPKAAEAGGHRRSGYVACELAGAFHELGEREIFIRKVIC